MAEQLELYSQSSGKELEETMSLTPRQREVLQLFAEGHSARKVAQVFNISVRTAKNHKAHIMNILGANSTVEFMRCALRLGAYLELVGSKVPCRSESDPVVAVEADGRRTELVICVEAITCEKIYVHSGAEVLHTQATGNAMLGDRGELALDISNSGDTIR